MGPKHGRRHADDDGDDSAAPAVPQGGGGRGGGRRGRGRGPAANPGRQPGKARAALQGGGAFGSGRRKSLLIGINYTGSQSALHGCQEDVENVAEFLQKKGYPNDKNSQIIMTDALPQNSPYYPSGKNILAAMDWLVKESGTCNYLHYSGHGGQVKDDTGDRESGMDDTIVPVDYEKKGQISSDTLHRHLVSAMPPDSTLFAVFDCCHSGSVIELPFLYRTDDQGNMNMSDNLKEAGRLVTSGMALLQGGFSMSKLSQAKDLASGATGLFGNFKAGFGGGGGGEEGLQQGDFAEDWVKEHKAVTMFSGCMDEQTSADANISGESQGAMSWAFLSVMQEQQNINYTDALIEIRKKLKASKYEQIPQLSVGYKEWELDQPLRF